MRGFRLGRIFGIDLVVDPSWLFIAVLVSLSLYVEFSSDSTTPALTWVVAIIGALLFFGCVLVHELSHSVVARRRGLEVKRIRLFIFGGVSEIAQEAATPQDEFAITAAGPASSLLLASLFYVARGALSDLRLVSDLLGLLGFVNLALGLFNLLPGFPLDGGRLLRSAVWRGTGDMARGTRVAVIGGKVVAAGLALAGLYLVAFRAAPGGFWYVAIGWFLYRAAAASLLDLESRTNLADMTVGRMMTPTMTSVDASISLQKLFDDHLLGGRSATFPVVEGGRVRGLVSLQQLTEVPQERWNDTTVRDIMIPLGRRDVVDADSPVVDVLSEFAEEGRRMAVVAEGRMVGVLTAVDVQRWLHRSRS